jgi:predicted DsbA family dithiol-disulfide isomerase
MIEVEIWSDFACPFCYIGKRHFELALERFEKRDQVRVTYRGFELDPNAEKSRKENIHQVLAQKYGQTLEWAKKANERVVKMGQECGLDFQMDRIIPSNSFDAHRLNHLAHEKGLQANYQDSLFKAYFCEGRDIAKSDELMKSAERAGLSPAEVQKVLDSQKFASAVREDEEQAQKYGISGVPFFLFNKEYGLSGAQPIETFLQVFRELSER